MYNSVRRSPIPGVAKLACGDNGGGAAFNFFLIHSLTTAQKAYFRKGQEMADGDNVMVVEAYHETRVRRASPPVRKAEQGLVIRRAINPLIRLLDISISLVALIFLAPIMVVAAILVWMTDKGPILFRQSRMGFNGKEFKCLKFRSMHTDSAAILERILATDPVLRAEWALNQKFKRDPRVTRIGHILRKSSIDELPQLFNVLKGEMSLVGPRPIVSSEIVKYGKSYKAYCSVMPGITGLWQVAGRSDVTYRRRVAMDRTFARKNGVTLYLWILVMTIPAVLFQKGSY